MVECDPETKLAIQITLGKKIGELMLNDSAHPEKFATSADEARSHNTKASLSGDSPIMSKPGQNRFTTARRIPPASSTDVSALTGIYRSDEIDSTFHVTGSAGMLYGCFDGYLGKGPEPTSRSQNCALNLYNLARLASYPWRSLSNNPNTVVYIARRQLSSSKMIPMYKTQ